MATCQLYAMTWRVRKMYLSASQHAHIFAPAGEANAAASVVPGALLSRVGCSQALHQLIGARCGAAAARVAFKHACHLIDALALDELADGLQVAVAAADEVDMLDGVAVKVDVDFARAHAAGLVGIHGFSSRR